VAVTPARLDGDRLRDGAEVGTAAIQGSRRSRQTLVAPWLGDIGQPAFYRQMTRADQAHIDEIEPLYPSLDLPGFVIWAARKPGSPSTAPIASLPRSQAPSST